jgi:hypothetical protein
VLAVKKKLADLLANGNYDEVSRLALDDKKIISRLISLTYDKDKALSWHAMEAIGIATKEIAKKDSETVRNIVGRLLWMIRDESGGIGWSVPEILGEIVLNNPKLCSDIAPVIVSFHEELMLTSGVLRAIGRVGPINNETVGYAIPNILPYLKSENSTVRGNAAFALGELGAIGAVVSLKSLLDDKGNVLFYKDRELQETTVGDLARKAVEKLEAVVG